MGKLVKLLCVCAVLVFVACKKNYSCACKTTIVDRRPPSTIKVSNSTQALGAKMTDIQATSACEAIKTQLQDNFSQQVAPVPQVSVIVSCGIL